MYLSINIHLNQFFLLSVCHLRQWEVFASQISLQIVQSLHDNSLHLASLCSRARGRQAESADTPPGTHSAGQDIFGIKVSAFKFGGVQVCGVLVPRFVAAMTLIDTFVKQISENLEIKMEEVAR